MKRVRNKSNGKYYSELGNNRVNTQYEKDILLRWIHLLANKYQIYNVDNKHQCFGSSSNNINISNNNQTLSIMSDSRRKIDEIPEGHCRPAYIITPFSTVPNFFGCTICGKYHFCHADRKTCEIISSEVDKMELCRYSGKVLIQQDNLRATFTETQKMNSVHGTVTFDKYVQSSYTPKGVPEKNTINKKLIHNGKKQKLITRLKENDIGKKHHHQKQQQQNDKKVKMNRPEKNIASKNMIYDISIESSIESSEDKLIDTMNDEDKFTADDNNEKVGSGAGDDVNILSISSQIEDGDDGGGDIEYYENSTYSSLKPTLSSNDSIDFSYDSDIFLSSSIDSDTDTGKNLEVDMDDDDIFSRLKRGEKNISCNPKKNEDELDMFLGETTYVDEHDDEIIIGDIENDEDGDNGDGGGGGDDDDDIIDINYDSSYTKNYHNNLEFNNDYYSFMNVIIKKWKRTDNLNTLYSRDIRIDSGNSSSPEPEQDNNSNDTNTNVSSNNNNNNIQDNGKKTYQLTDSIRDKIHQETTRLIHKFLTVQKKNMNIKVDDQLNNSLIHYFETIIINITKLVYRSDQLNTITAIRNIKNQKQQKTTANLSKMQITTININDIGVSHSNPIDGPSSSSATENGNTISTNASTTTITDNNSIHINECEYTLDPKKICRALMYSLFTEPFALNDSFGNRIDIWFRDPWLNCVKKFNVHTSMEKKEITKTSNIIMECLSCYNWCPIWLRSVVFDNIM